MLPIGPGVGPGHFPDTLGISDWGEAAVTHAGVQRGIPASRETKLTDSLNVRHGVQGQHYPVGSIDPEGRSVEPPVSRAGRIAHQHQAHRPVGQYILCPPPGCAGREEQGLFPAAMPHTSGLRSRGAPPSRP